MKLIKIFILSVIFFTFIFGTELRSNEIVKHSKPPVNDLTHILKKNDFKMLQAECTELEDSLYFIKGELACPVWQCFPISYFKFKCDDNAGDEEMPTALIIEIFDKANKHFLKFQIRRTYLYKHCLSDIKKLTAIIKKQKQGCIAGWYFDDDPPHPPFLRQSYWRLEKVVTKKGRWSYFLENEGDRF